MKHILFLTSSYPRHRQDPSGHFIKTLVQSLTARKYKVTVLCPSDCHVSITDDISAGEEIKRFNYFFRTRWQKLAYGDGMPQNLQKNPWAIIQIPFYLISQIYHGWRIVQHCDLIHAHWIVPGGLTAAILKKITGKRFILTIHSSDLWILIKTSWGRCLLKWVVKQSDKTICVSKFAQKKVEEICMTTSRKEQFCCIPMGIEKTSPQPLPIQLQAGDRLKLLYMGRLVPIKGVDLLIQAIVNLVHVELTVVGDGEERNNLMKLAEELKVPVTFHSSKTGEEKTALFKEHHLVIFPSRDAYRGYYEGVPVTLLEALSYGKTVIVSDTGGCSETIQHGANGVLFKANSIDALRTELSFLVSNPGHIQSFSEPAIQTASRYTWNELFSDLLPLYG